MDVAVSTQLQQWTFEKPRPQRSDSSASSPDLSQHDAETLRLDTAAADESANLESKESLSLQERYMSSEEDLSPMEGNDSDSDIDDHVSIHDFEKECFHARKMSISRFEKGKSCDMAVMVSYVSAGRPKMIDLATTGSPIRETAQRSASIAVLPIAAINKLRDADQSSRLSLAVSSSRTRSISPAYRTEARRPSTEHLPYSHSNSSRLQLSDAASFTEGSTRSSSPSVAEKPSRPVSVAAHRSLLQGRSSLYVSTAASAVKSSAPLTPLSPGPHEFLSSDPYENSTSSAASPIIKSGSRKRLRSISMKLSLAKIAITPSTKKWDSRINGRPNMPPTPATPYTPATPQTAPPTSSVFSSPKNRLRRNSRISRPNSVRGPSPELPPVPALSQNALSRQPTQKLVARGANEREPTLELPPCPSPNLDADPMDSIKSRRLRKRKSLMSLMDSL